MSDWEGYTELCTELEIEHSEGDEIDAGNHRIMKALLERVKNLEVKVERQHSAED